MYLIYKRVLEKKSIMPEGDVARAVIQALLILEYGGYLRIQKRKGKNFSRSGLAWLLYERNFLENLENEEAQKELLEYQRESDWEHERKKKQNKRP